MEDTAKASDRTKAPPAHARTESSGAAFLVRTIGNHPNIVGVLGTLAAIVVVAVAILIMAWERDQAIKHAREVSENFATIITLELERDLRFHDAQLRSMVRNAEDPVTWTVPVKVQRRLLFCEMPADAYVSDQFLIDAKGQVIASQNVQELGPGLRLSDREYFLKHKSDASAALLVSHPFRSRLPHGQWVIMLSRRVDGPDGSFAGIALFEVQLALFQRLFDRIEVGPPGIVSIMLDDGTILATKPYSDEMVGVSVAHTPVYRNIVVHGDGSTIATGSGGVERLYSYRRTSGMPFIATVAPAMRDVLRDWRRQRRFVMGLAVLFGVVLTSSAWLLARTLQAKLRAEMELKRLATTDGLTALNNRRTLDLRLENEWHHALRSGSFLSVLFIDIDRFKLYNDTYGHAAGDDMLALVARSIEEEVRRSIDCVGRYGGEEFVAVLPATTSEGAMYVAERVRKRIEALDVANPGSETGIVTVSIGCATCQPSHEMHVDDLVAEADKQLYRAKSSGRNRVLASVLLKEEAA